MGKKIPNAHNALELIKKECFPGVDWQQQSDCLNPDRYPEFCMKWIDYLLGRPEGAEELPWVFEKFYKFDGNYNLVYVEDSPFNSLDLPENALSQEELQLVDALAYLSFVSAYLYNHLPFDLTLLGIAVDDNHRLDFSVTNMALCHFVEHTPYRRLAVMMVCEMYWAQLDAVIAKDRMLQDYMSMYGGDYNHYQALESGPLACDEYVEGMLVDLRRLKRYEVKAKGKYGMDDDTLIIYNSLCPVFDDEIRQDLLAAARRLKTLTDQLLETGGDRDVLEKQLDAQARQLVADNGLWVDPQICYSYLLEFFADKYAERFGNPR